MLPAPGSGSDDRDRLYRKETWGTAPANGDFLKRASSFHESLAKVVDPERLVYVAGYDRDTPTASESRSLAASSTRSRATATVECRTTWGFSTAFARSGWTRSR